MANKWDDNVSDSLLIMLSNFFTGNYWSNKIGRMRQHDVNRARTFLATSVGNILTSLFQTTREDLPNNCIISDANMDLVKRGLGRLTYNICTFPPQTDAQISGMGNIQKRTFVRNHVDFDLALMQKFDKIGMAPKKKPSPAGSEKERLDRTKRRELRTGFLYLLSQRYRPLCAWDKRNNECYAIRWGNQNSQGFLHQFNNDVIMWRGEDRTPGEIERVGGFFSKYESTIPDVNSRIYALTSGLRKDTSPYRAFQPWNIIGGFAPLAIHGHALPPDPPLFCGDYLYFRNGLNDANMETVVSVTPDYIVCSQQLQQLGCPEYVNCCTAQVTGISNCAQLNSVFPLKTQSKKRRANFTGLNPTMNIPDGQADYDICFVYMLKFSGWAFDMCKYQKDIDNTNQPWPEMQIKAASFDNVLAYICYLRIHQPGLDNGSKLLFVPIASRSEFIRGSARDTALLKKAYKTFCDAMLPHMSAWRYNGANGSDNQTVWQAIRDGKMGGIPLIVIYNNREVGAAIVDEYIKEERGSKCLYKMRKKMPINIHVRTSKIVGP